MRTSHLQLVLFAALAVMACGPSGPDRSDVQAAEIGADGSDGGLASDASAGRSADAGPATRVRVVAANLTSGNEQSYDPGEGTRILQGLAPDVVLLQEFNDGDNSDTAIRGFVDTTFGTAFAYTREPHGQIPNGVVSRYPILDSGSWQDPQTATRGFAWARIDVPGDKDLWAVSLHLLTSSSGERQGEAQALVAQIRATVPEADYLVLGGDLNTGSHGEGCVQTLGAIVRSVAPFPADGSGNWNTSGSRSKPHDWVLADRDLDALEIPVSIGGATFASGLVFDSRVFRPLEAVAPVRAGDSAAANMQHMAVVRDFALPN